MVALRMSLYFSSKGSVRPCAAQPSCSGSYLSFPHCSMYCPRLQLGTSAVLLVMRMRALTMGAVIVMTSHTSAEQAQSPPNPALT